MNPYLKQYQQTQMNTAPKEQILLMLYDGAVRFLYLSKAGFAEKNIEKIHNNIVRVQKIITEFEASLDMENGGEFAKNLYGLYEFMSGQLTQANIKKKEECLDIVIKHMTELRDTWREAIKNFKAAGNTFEENAIDKYGYSSKNTDDEEETEDEDEEQNDGMGEYL